MFFPKIHPCPPATLTHDIDPRLASQPFPKRPRPFKPLRRGLQVLPLALGIWFAANQAAQCLTLSWDANTETNIAGYYVYSGSQSGNYSTKLNIGNKTSASLTTPAAGTTGYYAVTAYNTAAQESPLSVEVKWSGDTVVAPATSLWASTAVPTLIDGGPDASVELGVQFRSDQAGSITGIRFYKASTNTGPHVANLWSSTGVKLATANFSSETASGWQQANFATPVAIAANTVYVASYHVNAGHYSADANYFAATGVDRPPLHAPANAAPFSNGVYAYGTGSLFPNQTWSSANYWVDVVYSPTIANLAISTAALPDATVNTAYSATLTATGGVAPYKWSITSGTLPAGLTLNSSTGVIAGTPSVAGVYSLTVQASDASSPVQSASKSLGLNVSAAAVSLWAANSVPALIDGGPDNPVELGVKFRADVAGKVTAIRFYKAATNTGTHVANLWSATGTRLASATYSGETASGWQTVSLSTPVAIAANTVYVVSYYAKNGHYSADANYFATAGIDNPPLHALANGVSGGNGVYRYGTSSGFPTSTWKAANYWVDLVFKPGQ